MIITVYKVPKLCFYSAIVEPDHFLVCLSFLFILERNTLTETIRHCQELIGNNALLQKQNLEKLHKS